MTLRRHVPPDAVLLSHIAPNTVAKGTGVHEAQSMTNRIRDIVGEKQCNTPSILYTRSKRVPQLLYQKSARDTEGPSAEGIKPL